MSVGGASANSQLCEKRLLEEQEHLPPPKRARLAPPPFTPDLSPCIKPRSPAPKLKLGQSLSKVGPYLLLEPCEGEETYRARHAQTERSHTCQVLPLHGYQGQLAAYAQLGRHDNICTLSEVVIGADSAYVFLPGHHGDLHTYVRSRKRLDEEEAGLLFIQMLKAVEHCHRNGVILHDVRLRKFVFMDVHRTRLALCGLDDSILLHDHSDDSLTDRHGCPAYVSPELLANGKAPYSGRAADVWSLGVSLYTMLVGCYPFQDIKPAALFAKIRRGTFSVPDWLSPQARCLISCMLRKSPSQRLTASQLLMHPWLTDHSSHTRWYQGDQEVPT